MVYLCIKDLVMDDNGEVAAVKGRAYEFEKTKNGLDYFVDEQFEKHNMDKDGMVEYFGVAVDPKAEKEIRCSACQSIMKQIDAGDGSVMVQPCQKCAERSAAEKVESGNVFRWLKDGVDVICPGDLQVCDGSIVPAAEDIHEEYNTVDHWPTFRQVDVGEAIKSVMADVAALKKIISGMQI